MGQGESRHDHASFQIYVKIPTGKRIMLYVTSLTTIHQIKEELVKQVHFGRKYVQQLCLISTLNSDEAFEDDHTLSHYDIRSGTTLLLRELEMTINVQTESGRICSVNVTPSMTIEEVKCKIQYQDDIPLSNQQRLRLSPIGELNDNRTISYYNIQDRSTLEMMTLSSNFRIFVNVPDPTTKSIVIDVIPTTTVNEIKGEVIKSFYFNHLYQKYFQLFYANRELKDGHTLTYYEIKPNSTLTIRELEMAIDILLRTLPEKTICVNVTPSMTISNVKSKIQDQEGIPFHVQKLVIECQAAAVPVQDMMMVCDDKHTISDYDIHSQSTIQVVLLVKRKVSAKLLSRKAVVLNAISSTTIRDLKIMLSNELYSSSFYSEYLQFLDSEVLKDDLTLSDYSELPEFTLIAQELEMTVTVKMAHETFSVAATPLMSIKSFKQKIQQLESVPTKLKHIRLSFLGIDLINEKTLSHYSIKEGSILESIGVQVYIRISGGETISLLIEPTDTIESIKDKILEKEKVNLPQDKQLVHLICNGHKLEAGSESLFLDCIQQEFMILLWIAQICVKCPNGSIVTINNVEETTTIAEVKSRICTNDINQKLVLFKENSPLEDSSTLKEYSIHSKSPLHYTTIAADEMLIVVKSPCGTIHITPVVTPSTTVQEIKAMIDQREAVLPGNQLYCQGSLLQDTQTLSDCKLQHPILCLQLRVFIVKSSGGTISLGVSSETTIKDLKAHVFAYQCLQLVQLVFDDQVLEDEHSLSYYNIQAESTLHVRESEMTIVVSSKCGDHFTLPIQVRPSTTVKEIKSIIQLEKRIPEMEQKLYFHGHEFADLEDMKTMSDCKIGNNNVLKLVFPVEVLVQISNGDVFKLRASTVQQLKIRIQKLDQASFPQQLQELMYNGEIIDNDYSLDNVASSSTLCVINQQSETFVCVKKQHGNVLTLCMLLSARIVDVKEKICEHEGIPSEEQQLFLSGRELVDSDLVSNCPLIERKRQLQLIVRNAILVQTSTGKVLTVKCFNVREAKYFIEKELGVPQSSQDLIYNGKCIEDDSLLFRIPTMAKLYLVDRDSTAEISVLVFEIKSKRKLSLMVSPSCTVAHIKGMVQSKLGIPPDHQVITFGNTELSNHNTLRNCKIHWEYMPCLYLVQVDELMIRVHLMDGKVVLFGITRDSTIAQLKEKIFSHESILSSIDLFYLINGIVRELEDHLTLMGFQPLLQLYAIPQGACCIFVVTYKNRVITCNLQSLENTTIEEVKVIVRQSLGIATNQQEFTTYNGKPLEDDHMLSDYGIQKGASIKLRQFYIYVKSLKLAIFTLLCEPSDTIDHIKKVVYNKEGTLPDQMELIYAGRRLQSGWTLSDYNIPIGSRLEEVLTLYVLDNISINVRFVTLTGRMLFLRIKKNNSIKSIITDLRQRINLSSDQHHLHLWFAAAGMILEDHHTLYFYKVQNGSTLYLVSTMQFVFELPSKESFTISLNVSALTTINDVRIEIEKNQTLDRDLQIVSEGRRLPDHHTLVECNVTDGSILQLVKMEDFEKELRHLEAIELAIQKKGTLSTNLMHGVFIGVPRSGKSSLMTRLLGEEIKDTSPSTGVMDRAVQVVVRKSSATAATIVTSPDSFPIWLRMSYDQEAIDLMMMTAHNLNRQVVHEISPPLMEQPPILPIPEPVFTQEPLQATLQSTLSHDFVQPVNPRFRSTNETEEPLPSGYKPPLEIFKEAVRNNGIEAIREQLEKFWLLYLTDTGGQIEFQELLPLLVSGPSVFFIVFRLNCDLNKPFTVEYVHVDRGSTKPYQSSTTLKDALLQSLASIAAMRTVIYKGGYSQSDETLKPKVFFIGTHKDLVDESKIAMVDHQLQELVKSTALYQEDLVEFCSESQLVFTVNNLSPDNSDFQKIRLAVDRIAARDKFRMISPSHWLVYSLAIRHLEDRTIAFKDALRVAKECGISDEQELDEVLWFLHNKMGVVRHFQEGDLHDIVVLDPQLLFDKVTELIIDTFTFENVGQRRADEFKKKGIFPVDIFQSRSIDRHKHLTSDHLVSLLEQLHIIAPYQTDEHPHQYFIPCVLSHTEDVPKSFKQPSTDVPSLVVTFKCGYIPKGLMGSLIVCLLRNEMKSQLLWKLISAMIFKNQLSFRVCVHNDIVTLRMDASHFSIFCAMGSKSNRSTTFQDVCSEIKRVVVKGITKVTSALPYSSDAEHSLTFYCPAVECESDIHPAEMTSPDGGSLWCERVNRSFDLPDGYQNWFAKPAESSHGNVAQHESVAVNIKSEQTSQCRCLNDKPHLWELEHYRCRLSGKKVNILNAVAAKWKSLASALHFEHFVIEEVQQCEHFQPRECCRVILIRWLSGEGLQPPCWEVLIRALKDIEHSELANEVQTDITSHQ